MVPGYFTGKMNLGLIGVCKMIGQAVSEKEIFENGGRRTDGRTTDGRTDDGAWVYYKLTL